MTSGIEAVTTKALALALDAAALRQQAIAANIANVDTAGWVPLTVSFEGQLADARHDLEGQDRIDPLSLAGVQPRLEPAALDVMGLPPKVQLDLEVARLAQNSLQYQAVVKGLSKHYAVLSAAISEGKK